MVADLMPRAGDPLQQIRIMLGLRPENKERGWRILLLENLKDLRSPFRIRTIVKSQGHLVRTGITLTRDTFGHRELVVLLQ